MEMSMIQFRTKVESGGKTATGIVVPQEVVESLNSGKRPAVKVTINGYTYRSTVASMHGQYMISVSAENREKTGVAAGDEVEVTLELDTEPREVEVPLALAEALSSNHAAKQTFNALSFSKKQFFVYQITTAKTDETRNRRVQKVLEELNKSSEMISVKIICYSINTRMLR
jgi:hypothetical protein